MTELRLELTDDSMAELVERVAAIVLEQLEAERPPTSSPFLTVVEAADVLRAKPQRVYDLLSSGRLSRHKDGSRVLIRRDELEAYLAGETARAYDGLDKSMGGHRVNGPAPA